MTDNTFGKQGINYISDFLKTNTSLTVLDLSSGGTFNCINRKKKHKTLLIENEIDGIRMRIICEGLKLNTTLNALNLGGVVNFAYNYCYLK